MANARCTKEEAVEVIGTCPTNTTAESTHDAKVTYPHLWSYAQQAALIAVSERHSDGRYRLIKDPERRAKRIAAHYADLYFRSAEKSRGKVQFYWVALAAFVVKDIVEAFRFVRQDILPHDSDSLVKLVRGSIIGELGSYATTNDSPYQHAIRTYAALAKGNLWLFMDIYPPLWFFLQYGIGADGTLHTDRLNKCLDARDWSTFQDESKRAVEELPFEENWLRRLKTRLENDEVYKQAKGFFNQAPSWIAGEGYDTHTLAASRAHQYCRTNIKISDDGYRMPPPKFWRAYKEAFYVMESEQLELNRVCDDKTALARLQKLKNFRATNETRTAFSHLVTQYRSASKASSKFLELVTIAQQEQINILQPLIYEDTKLKETLDLNHFSARLSGGWIAPPFKVVYSSQPSTTDPSLETVFDQPKNKYEQFFGKRNSLPIQDDRTEFVRNIARQFDALMKNKTQYMEQQLKEIRQWLQA
nr:hypothetical protein [uncultured Massilia sp.]